MKTISTLVVASALLVSSLGFSSTKSMVENVRSANLVRVGKAISNGVTFKVGDAANYDLTIVEFQMKGTDNMAVTAVTDTTVTITDDINIAGQAQKAVEVIDLTTGKVISITVNGQAQTIPDQTMTVVSQVQEKVTVPCPPGTFDSLHLVVEDAQKNQSDIQINPSIVPVAGMLKMTGKQQGFSLLLELTSFARGT